MSPRRYDDVWALAVVRVERPPTIGDRLAVWSCTTGAELVLGVLVGVLRVAWNVTLASGRAARGLVRAGAATLRDDLGTPRMARTVLPEVAIMLGLVLFTITLVVLVTYAATGHL